MIKFAALALAAVVIVPAPAAAAEDVRVAHVSIADLNLSTPAGRAAFDRRIRVAVATVCAEPMPNMLQMQMKERACRRAALTDVAAKVALKDAPQLARR